MPQMPLAYNLINFSTLSTNTKLIFMFQSKCLKVIVKLSYW